jgi:hypothetical protein
MKIFSALMLKKYLFCLFCNRQKSTFKLAFYVFAVVFSFTLAARGQSISTSFSNILKIDSAEFKKANWVVSLQFGKMDFEIEDEKMANQLAGADSVFVKMYYSKFPQTIDYQANNQKMLNDGRVKNLFKNLPCLESKHLVFEAVRQDACKNEAEARLLFHGFLIAYTLPKQANLQPEPKSDEERKKEFYKQYQHFNIKELDSEFAKEIKRLNVGRDSTTYEVFERNFADLDSIVIVADWTSSMQPYTLQLLVWQVKKAMKANYILGYVFFNDGDTTPDKQKKIGQTGGIYVSKSPNFADALQKMDECKKNGNGGGDFDENNIEVLLRAIEEFPNAKHFMMIADNFGKIKDISLLPKVSKPIHTVLAKASKYYATVDYIQLAIQTKGSLHFKEFDLKTEAELKAFWNEIKDANDYSPYFKKQKKGKAPKH